MVTLLGGVLAERNMSQAEFARRAGVSTKHLNQALNFKASVRLATLDYWAWVLGYHFEISLSEGRS